MKKGSASLVVLSIIFLISALLIYLFQYVGIERMMYVNRSKMKQFTYNYESLENIITKDIEATYLNGGDIEDIPNKNYSVFEGQIAQVVLNNTIKKNAFSIFYYETLSNNKEKSKEGKYSLLNRIFLKNNISKSEKEEFYNLIKENEVQEFTVEEINNYFNESNEEGKNFNYENAIIKITQDASADDINVNLSGSGILIIDGDINILGRVEFKGLIIIDGNLSLSDNNEIYGEVIDLNKKSHIDYTKSLHTMYQNCKNYKGIIKVTKSN